MMESLKWLARYLMVFGLKGVYYYWLLEVVRRETVMLPGYSHPVTLRKNTTDLRVFREVFLFREYALDIEAPEIIVDAGANIGLTSIYFSIRYPNAKIIAVEPATSNFEMLLKNTSGESRITPVHSGVWSSDTWLKIRDERENAWAFTVVPCGPDEPGAFQAVSITGLMAQFQLTHIDLLKLDIEGSERELFSTQFDWLHRTRHLVVEIHDWIHPDTSRQVFETLGKFSFTTRLPGGVLMLTNRKFKASVEETL